MTTQQQEPPAENQHADGKNQQLFAEIGKHLLRTLGQPVNLQRVQVRALWDNHFRANVLVGTSAMTVRIAHSYFLRTDSDGKILESTPRITRQY